MNPNRAPRVTPIALSLALLSLPISAALAQTAPDAGRTLQQQAPVLEAPKPAPELRIEAPKPAPTPPGGAQVLVQSVGINGNTLFTEAELLAVLGEVAGKSYDLAGLRSLAERVGDYYHQAGYPFARGYLPPQPLDGGALRIEVVEGQYGEVKALGEGDLAADAQHFLAQLKPGELIESSALERATLILDDQPGIKAMPIIRPGQVLGTGDLDVRVERSARFTGEVGLDNQGNRYTGQTRARFNLEANSPFMLGDQVTLRSLATEGGMWFGNLGYSLPLGASGLRGQASYSHTYYELGKSFSSLNATGTADATSLGLSYPIVRSQRSNLNLSGAWQHKKLNDKQGATSSDSDKSSDSLPLTLGFDLRDGLGGGGLSYGSAVWTSGNLKLDRTLSATDATTAKTEGKFNKLSLDVARIQAVANELSVYGHLSSQWADKNLDSSERFGLGGPTGVRAYPVGEGNGDEGWLVQLELRYAMGAFSPYLFHDSGWVKVNAKPWSAGNNERSISGSGLGLRYQEGSLSADLALAWRGHGGVPQSDTTDNVPQVWLTTSYKF